MSVTRDQRMDVVEAIERRGSVKRFTDRPIAREEIEALLDLAVLAPNHRMTEPWGFLVLGPEGKMAYARVLARRKCSKIEDPEAREAVREKVIRGNSTVPAIIAVTCAQHEDPEIREEDYAATYMAVQNILLGAVARGLGAQIKTGAVMDDPELREALDVPSDRRIVALVFLGEPEEVPAPVPRTPASEKTRWLP